MPRLSEPYTIRDRIWLERQRVCFVVKVRRMFYLRDRTCFWFKGKEFGLRDMRFFSLERQEVVWIESQVVWIKVMRQEVVWIKDKRQERYLTRDRRILIMDPERRSIGFIHRENVSLLFTLPCCSFLLLLVFSGSKRARVCMREGEKESVTCSGLIIYDVIFMEISGLRGLNFIIYDVNFPDSSVHTS